MTEEFKVSPQMTKKELIAEYTRLLEGYKKKVEEAGDAEKWRSEAEKYKEAAALKTAKDATVEAVIDSVTGLKAQLGKTLMDLTDKMASQAERLEEINMAVALQERRLAELYEIEATSDTLAKLIHAYQERKAEAEAEFDTKKNQLERDYQARFEDLQAKHSKLTAGLEEETRQKRSSWEEEKKEFERELAEEKRLAKQGWEREQTEYVYQRDRSRKIEEDDYQAKRTQLEKELEQKKEQVLRQIEEREAAVAAREAEIEDLRKQVKQYPSALQKEIENAKKEVTAVLRQEMDQERRLLTTEREWERKVYEQKISFLENTIASQEQKIQDLKAEIAQAMKQVHQIAEKAIEGASQNRAFSSVKEIALEQARKSESAGKKE
jgi:uncharacterized coiled-coil protein SlyX